jgi:SAM-dependent methyltransferase
MNNAKCFDKICEKYYSAYGTNPEYTYFLDEFMHVVRKGKILDIGCGVGVPAAKYLVTRGYGIIGVDNSKKMIEAAKQNVPQAEFRNVDICKMDLDEQSYDGAVSFFTFNFMKKKDFEKSFEKIKASIKEEGGLLIGVIEGDFEGETTLLGEKVYLHKLSEEYLKDLLKDFHISLVERRDYQAEGEEEQNQLFIIAKKKTYVEMMLEQEEVSGVHPPKEEAFEDKVEEKHKEEQAHLDESGNLVIPAHKEVVKKEEKKEEEEESDEEEPAIRITFFRKKKKHKDESKE